MGRFFSITFTEKLARNLGVCIGLLIAGSYFYGHMTRDQKENMAWNVFVTTDHHYVVSK